MTPVNAALGARVVLAGMTLDAIESWQMRAQAVSNLGVDSGRVAAILREVAVRSNILADNSRDVFEADELVAPESLDVLASMLQQALERGAG